MMKKILLIGKRSTLSKIYVKKSRIKNFDIFSHRDLKKINYSKYSHLINFSFSPKLMSLPYRKEIDIDKKLAIMAKENNIIYIFLSTRYVYSKSNIIPASEKIKRLKPENNYGKNKLKIEKHLKKTLKKNLLILRLGTFLFLKLSSKGKLFSEKMLYSLYQKKLIFFDFKNNIYKDFITDDHFVENLDYLIKKKVTGLYNLSSGIPIFPKDIAANVIKTFHKGKIVFENKNRKAYSFLMSNKKIINKTGIILNKKKILDFCREMGKKLKHE